MSAGKLVICPTPIGNLGDITQRTIDALNACDVVCAEDTRVTGKLLAAYGIKKRLERLDEALITQRCARIIERVCAGECIAYCSDAGMPGISDPGLRLVRAAREAHVPVEVLPGASAASTAYVTSGCVSERFFFAGFFPRKAGEREALLAQLAPLDAALIFYESPNRLVDALAVLADAFPYRTVTVCRELTKLHEEVRTAPAPELAALFAHRAQESTIKGEIVIVVDGPNEQERSDTRERAQDAAVTRARELRAQGMSKKDVVRALTEEFNLPRNAAYDIVLSS